MIAQELEISLHMAFVEARQARHEFITVEHLLLALLDNPSSAKVLRACSCDIEELRQSLQKFVSDNTPVLPQSSEADTQPTLGFQRVIQRAIMHVQSTSNGKQEVTGADVVVAVFGEKDSHAVYYLHQQGVTRLDVVNYLSHGITKAGWAGVKVDLGGQADRDRAAALVLERLMAQAGDGGSAPSFLRVIWLAIGEYLSQGISEAAPGPGKVEPGGEAYPDRAQVSVLDDLVAQGRDGRMHASVERAIFEAREAKHRYVTVEHLLLGLLEDVSAAQVLRAWACDIESLRKDLVRFVSDSMRPLPESSAAGTRAGAGFIRVVQRATTRAIVRDMTPGRPAPDGKPRASSADMLAAILDEEDSYATTCFRSYTPNLGLLGQAGGLGKAGGPA